MRGRHRKEVVTPPEVLRSSLVIKFVRRQLPDWKIPLYSGRLITSGASKAHVLPFIDRMETRSFDVFEIFLCLVLLSAFSPGQLIAYVPSRRANGCSEILTEVFNTVRSVPPQNYLGGRTGGKKLIHQKYIFHSQISAGSPCEKKEH